MQHLAKGALSELGDEQGEACHERGVPAARWGLWGPVKLHGSGQDYGSRLSPPLFALRKLQQEQAE